MDRKIFLCLIALLLFYIPLIARNDVRIEIFRGCEIAPYTQQIVELCNAIYREPPYLYNGEDEEYTAYIESYSQSNDAIICLAFDNEKAVGLAIATPMLKTRDLYKKTLLEHGYELDSLFYLGEFGLNSNYHNCGIEEAIYYKIENLVRKADAYSMICLWEIEDLYQKNFEDTPGHDFWNKLGFLRHREVNFEISWTNIGDSKESTHLAVYSIKIL